MMILYYLIICIITLIFSISFTIGIIFILIKISTYMRNVERFVDINLDISDTVYSYIEKHNITIEELAKRCRVTTSKIKSWLSGFYDLKLSEITSIENALNKNIIKAIPLPRKKQIDESL